MQTPSIENRLRHVLAFVEERLVDGDFKLGEIAARFRLSDRYVRRLFQRTDESPSGFVLRRRLERAAAMMVDPARARQTLLAIALDCGFNDAATFSRSFHRRFGVAPRAYRRSHRPYT